jgi:prevent-host-death family protein
VDRRRGEGEIQRSHKESASGGPQTITSNGRTAGVIVAAEEWLRKTKRAGNLAEFFAASPLRGSGMGTKRLRNRPQKLTYELSSRHQRGVGVGEAIENSAARERRDRRPAAHGRRWPASATVERNKLSQVSNSKSRWISF